MVQILSVVSLCWLASTEEEFHGNTPVLGHSSGPYTNIWVGEVQETTDVS